ncbi:MAG: hypothetical protein ACLFRF_01445 [Desulfobacterales bacterium]
MDALWAVIVSGINQLQAGLYQLISPLHVLGPAFTIAVLAVVTVLFARFFTRRFKTRRYRELEQEFKYWFDIKQEALKLREAEPEKAKQLGVNIDKGKLNEVYYNYFFEGLLNNLLTMYIPIFSMLAFVNYTYQPAALKALFGKSQLFILYWINGQTYAIGAVFWFVFCVFAAYLAFFVIGRIYRRYQPDRKGRNSLAGCEA